MRLLSDAGWRQVLLLILVALLGGSLASRATAESTVPPLSGRAIDDAGILAPATEETLESLLARLEEAAGLQLVVLTIPSLADEPIESYALRVAQIWELGSRARDDGVLLVVAVGDRQARIEVGYGLEDKLPDVVAGRIIRDTMTPHFRRGDYDRGVLGAVREIAERLAPGEAWSALEAEAGVPSEQRPGPPSETESPRAEAAASLPHETNWEHVWVWVVFLLLMPLAGSVFALFARDAETRGIIFAALSLPILLGASLATDELVDLPSDSGKFLLGGVAALILFSIVFWWLHFRLKKAADARMRWQERLDALASGRLVFGAVEKAAVRLFHGSETAARWLRRAVVALVYLAIGGCIARYWHMGYAVFYFHNLFWLLVIFRCALHPSPASEPGKSWFRRSGRGYSPVSRRSSSSGVSTASSSRPFRGGGGSFGGGGASGRW